MYFPIRVEGYFNLSGLFLVATLVVAMLVVAMLVVAMLVVATLRP